MSDEIPTSLASVPDGADRAAPRRSPPGLTVCSLCVGETLGDSDVRAGGQLARLRALEADGTARLTLSECLDECERGDVLVARSARSGGRRSGRPVWLERVAGDRLTGDLATWLAQGGPGHQPLPASLDAHVIDRSAGRAGRTTP